MTKEEQRQARTTELVIKASQLEEGLVQELEDLIHDNKILFDGEKVVLMADAHKGKDIPVGFTMTLSKKLVPPTFVSADIGCGMTSFLIQDLVPSKHVLTELSKIARDIIQVNRKIGRDMHGNDALTDLGTLGNGNHFVEIGTNGKDTLITVHSGSRSFGGETFKKHLAATKQYKKKPSLDEILSIEPKLRSEYIKNFKEKNPMPTVPLLDLTNEKDYFMYKADIEAAIRYASLNRFKILHGVHKALMTLMGYGSNVNYLLFETIHNYVEFLSDGKMIVRKGSIAAPNGAAVIIPINMRDGIILGISKNTEDINFSLPHGAGRVMSRTAAFKNLDLETFKEDMKDIISPTINQNTLDESPRAYKDIDTILKDITPYLETYEVFKPLFNFKGE